MHTVTRQVVQNKLLAYLNRDITLNELVDWAENMIMDGEFDEPDVDMLTSIVAHLGLADVREFGLSWDDVRQFLERLGYRVQVSATPV
jgi:hypothetical protein